MAKRLPQKKVKQEPQVIVGPAIKSPDDTFRVPFRVIQNPDEMTDVHTARTLFAQEVAKHLEPGEEAFERLPPEKAQVVSARFDAMLLSSTGADSGRRPW